MKTRYKILKGRYEIINFTIFSQNINIQYEYANESVDDVISSPFSYILLKHIRVNIILYLFRVDIKQVLHSHSWNMGFLSFLWIKWMENCEAMTSSTQYFKIHIDCSRNILWTLRKIQNVVSFLFLSNFHQIFTVLYELSCFFVWYSYKPETYNIFVCEHITQPQGIL